MVFSCQPSAAKECDLQRVEAEALKILIRVSKGDYRFIGRKPHRRAEAKRPVRGRALDCIDAPRWKVAGITGSTAAERTNLINVASVSG